MAFKPGQIAYVGNDRVKILRQVLRRPPAYKVRLMRNDHGKVGAPFTIGQPFLSSKPKSSTPSACAG